MCALGSKGSVNWLRAFALADLHSVDATPLRKIPLNKVPFVPQNEPLLGILDKFQEGRSHMAIVSRFSKENVGLDFPILAQVLTAFSLGR